MKPLRRDSSALGNRSVTRKLGAALHLTTAMTASAETQIPLLEQEWMDAWVKQDHAACERFLADDFLLTGARGVLMSKSQWLATLGSFICTSFSWKQLLVRAFGDSAIVHGRAHQQAAVEGQDWSGVFLITDVWTRRNRQWQVVARHGTGPLKQ